MTATTPKCNQALAEAAFLEGAQRIGYKYGVKVNINFETFEIDYDCEDVDIIVKLAMELGDLHEIVQKRFYGKEAWG